MTQHCELIELQAQPTLSMRLRCSVAQLPGTIGQAYAQIYQYLTVQGELPHGAPYVAYYNMDMENLDIEAGVPAAAHLPEKGEIKLSEIPAGRYGSAYFTGPYQEMNAAYEALTLWMQANKFEPTGTVYEIYLNDPQQVSPQDLQTRILFPLR